MGVSCRAVRTLILQKFPGIKIYPFHSDLLNYNAILSITSAHPQLEIFQGLGTFNEIEPAAMTLLIYSHSEEDTEDHSIRLCLSCLQ